MAKEVKLPGTVTLRYDTSKVDKETLEILKCLYINDKKDLPFTLHHLVSWPNNERSQSDRAEIFLKNGYHELVTNSGKEKVSTTNNEQPKEKKDDNGGFPVPKYKF